MTSIDFRFPPIPGAKLPEPQPPSSPRHNRAAQTACAFIKFFHGFNLEDLSISTEGSAFINAASGFCRNLPNRENRKILMIGSKCLHCRHAADSKQSHERVGYFGLGVTSESLPSHLMRNHRVGRNLPNSLVTLVKLFEATVEPS